MWANQRFKRVLAVSFDYGQRHDVELKAAQTICRELDVPHETIQIPLLSQLTKNALTDRSVAIDAGHPEGANPYSRLPSTFVDGRNAVFLLTAAIYAKQRGIADLVTGVCQTDYSGYPDCRAPFIKSMQKTLRLAMEYPFRIHTPLMDLTKAETVQLMQKLGGIELIKNTHTCYAGTRPACGKCPACLLRLKGFKEAGVKDPIKYE
ncbi:7-cyano-7-deazaguanine synthase QueC [Candidatus Peregrinibacteria bacterium]|nr:7-cyano-7-deazaguanine synthase QueC [Candidatus Peregrinibacteria bacterium]